MEEIIASCGKILCVQAGADGVNSGEIQGSRAHISSGHIPWTTFLSAMWVPPHLQENPQDRLVVQRRSRGGSHSTFDPDRHSDDQPKTERLEIGDGDHAQLWNRYHDDPGTPITIIPEYLLR